jgi:hypothetical protein
MKDILNKDGKNDVTQATNNSVWRCMLNTKLEPTQSGSDTKLEETIT